MLVGPLTLIASAWEPGAGGGVEIGGAGGWVAVDAPVPVPATGGSAGVLLRPLPTCAPAGT
jgi:hypothetical protein